LADHLLVAVQYSGHVGHQDQFGGTKRHRNLGSRRVSVDVVGVSVVAEANRSDDRDVAPLQHRHDRLWVDLDHAAYQAQVGVQLFAEDAGAVFAVEAARLAAHPVAARDQLWVHLPGQHHLHYVHRRGVGDPEAVAEPGLQAEPLAHRGDLWTPPVDQHRLHADVAKQHQVEQRLLLPLVDCVATDLDDHGLAVKTLDVRQGLDQHLRALVGVDGHSPTPPHVVYSALTRTYSPDRSQPHASALPEPRP